MKKSIFLVLDNIRSLYNVGSIFRSADAFGVAKIYLCGITAFPAHRQMQKISKTALGAQNSVPWEYEKSQVRLIKKLKAQEIRIVSLEIQKNATALSQYKPQFPIALVLGNEISGISKKILDISDDIIFIPQRGEKESLNVAIAASIALYTIVNY